MSTECKIQYSSTSWIGIITAFC